MGFDFAVLGATGMQGRIVSRDLLEKGYSVLMCGRDKSRVEKMLGKYKNSSFAYIEMRNVDEVKETISKSKADVVVNCVEGDWNLHALSACKSAGVHCIDLGSEIWMTKEQLAMHSQFQKKGLIHITGAGSVPGIGNVMLKYASEKLDKIDSIDVGFAWNSNIKKFVVPFSIQSILEEFLDPAPKIENGKMKKENPLDLVKNVKHSYVEEQKEFPVRHPETYTFNHYFKRQGVKNINFYAGFPEHSFDKIMAMIDLGLCRKDEMNFRGMKVKPVEFLTELLKDLKTPEGYKEKENLWVDVYGIKDGKKKKILMECLVPTLKGWEDAGCNIDTGLPASIMAQMIKTGIIKERGCFAPEGVVPVKPFFEELKKKEIRVYENGKLVN